MSRVIERITSGRRVVRAADDPAGFAVAENLSARARGARVAQRNLNDGRSLMMTLDGAASEVGELLKRIRELAVQSASETLGDDERAFIDTERAQLTEEVDRIAWSTELFGRRWADGSAGTISVQAGPDPGDTIDVATGDVRATTLGIDALDLSTAAGAAGALGPIDDALDLLNQQRARFGASMNRLEIAERLAQGQELVHTEAASRIVDADMALEVAEMAKAQMRMQASVAALMRIQEANRSYMTALLG
jgi:flagellin